MLIPVIFRIRILSITAYVFSQPRHPLQSSCLIQIQQSNKLLAARVVGPFISLSFLVISCAMKVVAIMLALLAPLQSSAWQGSARLSALRSSARVFSPLRLASTADTTSDAPTGDASAAAAPKAPPVAPVPGNFNQAIDATYAGAAAAMANGKQLLEVRIARLRIVMTRALFLWLTHSLKFKKTHISLT